MDWISLDVLASWVLADVIDDTVEATGKNARRRGREAAAMIIRWCMGVTQSQVIRRG
jgi:hypothetical protein